MSYATARSRPCLSTDRRHGELGQLLQTADSAVRLFDLRKGPETFRWVPRSGSGGAVGVSEAGAPVFGPAPERGVWRKSALPSSLDEATLGLWLRVLEWPSADSGETLLFGTRDLSVGLTLAHSGAYDRQFRGYWGPDGL